MSLYEWLDQIEARPGMYLSRPGFDSLCTFFLGYDAALLSNKIIDDSSPPFTEFHKFVQLRLPEPERDTMMDFGVVKHLPTGETIVDYYGPGWQTTIKSAVADDQERFHLFFKLLHEFRNSARRAQ
jgi:hypothetical protein